MPDRGRSATSGLPENAHAQHMRKKGYQRVTHGRHCTCGACARRDWTDPDLAPCGMHGSDCPALYQPWAVAGTDYHPATAGTVGAKPHGTPRGQSKGWRC